MERISKTSQLLLRKCKNNKPEVTLALCTCSSASPQKICTGIALTVAKAGEATTGHYWEINKVQQIHFQQPFTGLS